MAPSAATTRPSRTVLREGLLSMWCSLESTQTPVLSCRTGRLYIANPIITIRMPTASGIANNSLMKHLLLVTACCRQIDHSADFIVVQLL